MEESYKKKEGKTTIYTSQPYDSYWSSSSTRAPRAFHSVILADGLKEELLKGNREGREELVVLIEHMEDDHE